MADNNVSTQDIIENENHSVRQFAPGVYGGLIGDGFGFFIPSRYDLIPSWETAACDFILRQMHYMQHGALWGGAVDLWIEKFLTTPYEISGGRNLTFKWQDLFFESDFGEGYDFMMAKALVDYLTLNRGMFIEKVSYGEADTPIKEGARILGLNHLDALRVVPTGNREIPYIYYSEYTGEAHWMHHTRIINVAHQPSPNTRYFGRGKSPLYNALTVANAQILLGRHQNELLSDQPPPGLVLFNNIKTTQVDEIMDSFEADRRRDGQSVYRAPVRMEALNPNEPATVTFIPLASVPPDFSYDKYMSQHVNLVALVLGLDPQDIWPLSGQALGTGTQSKILDSKTQTKGPGYLLTRMERVWNVLLPRSLEWKYKAQNNEQDIQTAQIAQTWVNVIRDSTFMNEDEKRQMAANQIPAFADVLLDEQGNVRLPEDDPKADNQAVIATDTAQLDTPDTVPQITADSEAQLATANPAQPEEKAIDDTESAFIDEMKAAMQDGIDRVVSKASTGSRIRGIIARYGKSAYIDGLEDGGVEGGELDEDDLRLIGDYNVWDSTYVTSLVDEIYSTAGMSETPDVRAPKWVSTLNRYYYGGIASADKNGMYIFTGDDGKENCATCASLKGVKHRMKWWVDHELRPGLDHHSFECGSWPGNCNHYLERVTK